MRHRVTFVWFSYSVDSFLFEQSFRAATETTKRDDRIEAEFVLADDIWNPVEDGVKSRFLAKENTRIFETTYRRTNMLLGGENLEGQVLAMKRAKDETKSDIIVKVDCDTLIYQSDWLVKLAESKTADITGVFDFGFNCHFSIYGFTYAIKSRIIDDLVKDVKKYPAHHHAWEDHEISSRIFRLRNGELDFAIRYLEGPQSGFIVRRLMDVNNTFVNSQACTFAWDYQTSRDKISYRKAVCDWMHHLNDIREGISPPFEVPKTIP